MIFHIFQFPQKNELICKRKIDVAGERSFDLITIKEPMYPFIVITITSLIFSLFGGFFVIKKRDVLSFLKILAVALTIIAIVSPWWMIQGSSSNIGVETSTKLFLIPSNLVTITSTSDIVAGEIAALPELFTSVMTLLFIALALGCILIIFNMVLSRFNKNRLSFLSLLFGFLAIGGSLFMFFYATFELAKVGVGSFFGKGAIDVSIPGEGMRIAVFCSWGPAIGFYLCLISICILFSILVFNIKKWCNEGTNSMRQVFNKKNLTKFLKRFMPLIGIIILIYLIINIGTDEIVSTFLKISPVYILLAAVLTIPRILIRNTAWQRILKTQKINVGYFKSLKIFLIGYFYGTVTPGYLGQLMRVPYLKEETNQPVGKLFVNSVVETIVHTLSLYLMLIIGTFLVIEYIPEAFPIACVFLLVTILIYIFFIKKQRGEKLFHFLIRLFIPKKLKPLFLKFVDTFYNDFPDVKSLIVPFLLGIPTWIIIYSQIYIIGLSLDIEVPYFVFLMLYPVANIIAFIPITSGGLGTREATLIFLFSFFGVSPEKALVISLAGHLLTDVLTGFYGFVISVIEARTSRKNLSDLEHLIEKSSEEEV